MLTPAAVHAQFHSYPSFQVPRVSTRDFTFAVADGGRDATTLLYQWRGSGSARSHLQLDAGLADGFGDDDLRLIIGGGLAQQVHVSDADFPLDMAFTAGVGGSFGDGGSLLRVPFGLSLGHTFAMDSPVALTPYVHPRVSVDYCSRCGPRADDGRPDGDTDIGVEMDVGLDARFTRAMAMRASVVLGSGAFGRGDAFGISLVWSPPGFR
jgi:hypothetical protein